MIGRLTGRLAECSPGTVVLDVGGVGYELQIPLSTFYTLANHDGRAVSLHVHTHVREDAIQLFGFGTAREREAFELVLGVSGVGPRIALAILSGIEVPELESAVAQADIARLQRIPGIGRKTAERLVVDLKDRFAPKRAGRGRGQRGTAPPRPGEDPGAPGGLRHDAASALVNLGYSAAVAERAVGGALTQLGDAATLETTLREALRSLVR